MRERFAAVNADLRAIPGEGAHAVRRDYLWMLIGQDDLIKPDRMVLRWFKTPRSRRRPGRRARPHRRARPGRQYPTEAPCHRVGDRPRTLVAGRGM